MPTEFKVIWNLGNPFNLFKLSSFPNEMTKYRQAVSAFVDSTQKLSKLTRGFKLKCDCKICE